MFFKKNKQIINIYINIKENKNLKKRKLNKIIRFIKKEIYYYNNYIIESQQLHLYEKIITAQIYYKEANETNPDENFIYILINSNKYIIIPLTQNILNKKDYATRATNYLLNNLLNNLVKY